MFGEIQKQARIYTDAADKKSGSKVKGPSLLLRSAKTISPGRHEVHGEFQARLPDRCTPPLIFEHPGRPETRERASYDSKAGLHGVPVH